MTNLLKAKSNFRKKGVTLTADKVKSGMGGSWRFAGEDNLIRTIQAPLSECGLEIIVTMEYLKEINKNTVKATLFHVESGESISSQIALPEVSPRNDKNNNPMYLDAEIERGKQFGYWSRILAIRLLGLSDIDPEDTNNMPSDISDEALKQASDRLEKLLEKSTEKQKTVEWLENRYKVSDYKNMDIKQINDACNLLGSKLNGNS